MSGYSSCIDDYTDMPIRIEFDHHEIHEGNDYKVNSYVDLAASGYFDIRITIPNSNKRCHFTWDIGSEAENTLQIYEGATISTAGTAKTPVNSNRNSTNTSIVLVDVISNADLTDANADTDVSGATLLFDGKTGSGRDSGGTHAHDSEIILKNNTIYTIRLKNEDNSATRWIDYELSWYETTPINAV